MARIWGVTVTIRNAYKGDSLGEVYMSQFIRAQQADMPSGSDGLIAFATLAVPVAAIVLALLLLVPPANAYFSAMRRAGEY